MSTDDTDFVFIDTAIGGVNKRNNVKHIDDYNPNGLTDCFRTYCRFTEELKTYATENINPETGKPSIAGYPGDAMTDILPFDFDSEGQPSVALGDARRFVRRLGDNYGVNTGVIAVFFSGNKGFSVDVPGDLFGGFAPHPDIGAMLRNVALDLAGDLETLDKSIYQKFRLWRTQNTRHGKSGLYKVRLSIAELFDLDIDAIRGLAHKPRKPRRAS